MTKILFISWDGPQTNYIESLFSPIFLLLQEKYGYTFHIIQFTWGDEERIKRTKTLCNERNIVYTPIKVYHRKPSIAILYVFLFKTNYLKKYIKDNNIKIVMPRGTTSAIFINRIIKKLHISYLFDADGFSQDERVDFGGWDPLGLPYNLYRYFEFKALHLSHGILVRSDLAANILKARAGNLMNNKITVITNGKNINDFKIDIDYYDQKTKSINLIYIGSLGPQYMFKEMLLVFKTILDIKPNSIFTILTGSLDYAKEILLHESNKINNSIVLKSVAPDEVPKYLQKSDVGFALRKNSFSMQGVAPIKLAEYLLSGVPVIASNGIGDTEYYLKNNEAAYLIDNENINNEIVTIVKWILSVKEKESIRKIARDLGVKHFDIMKTVDTYHNAISKL